MTSLHLRRRHDLTQLKSTVKLGDVVGLDKTDDTTQLSATFELSRFGVISVNWPQMRDNAAFDAAKFFTSRTVFIV